MDRANTPNPESGLSGTDLIGRSASKHTTGPWHVNYAKFNEVLASNGALVATCNKLGSLTDLQANAKAIALAPELIGLAQRLAALRDGLNNGNSAAEHEACLLADKAHAILAKATGA